MIMANKPSHATVYRAWRATFEKMMILYRLSILIFIATLLLGGCKSTVMTPVPTYDKPDQPQFFKCSGCQQLFGGIKNLGKFRSIATGHPECPHKWEEISREEFKQLGEKWHNTLWTDETLWIKFDNNQ